jgi:FkbM family methyltransferase
MPTVGGADWSPTPWFDGKAVASRQQVLKKRMTQNKPLLFPIAPLLPILPRIKIVDVGAMILEEGAEPYAELMKALPCDLYGFEPVAAEFEKLKAQAKPGHHYLPYFIGDGTRRTFYECNYTMTSSLFEPNTPLLAKFQNLEELVRVEKTYPVETKRLDDIPELKGTDLLKVDVQGAELLVFEGASNILDDVLVVHTEVEFVSLYKNQPLFGDIDVHMRSKGFALHQILPVSRVFKPLIFNNDINAGLSQILWGDAVYVRDFMSLELLPRNSLLKLAAILHENYRSVDMAAAVLAIYDQQNGSSLQQTYIQKLMAG